MAFSKSMNRIAVEVNDNGARQHEYGHGAVVKCRSGWNDSCPFIDNTMSVDELRDLRYLIDRAIAYADNELAKRP